MLERLRIAHASLRDDGSNAFDVMVLAAKEVFLDRADLRESLKVIQDEDEPELVLQVVGDPATGKSYTFELIANAAPSYDFSTALVKLDNTGTADDVVEGLAAQLRVRDDELPERGSDIAKWYSRVAMRLVIKAADTRRHWWLVIDGLNHLPSTSEVWDLVRRLALNVRWYGEGRVRLALLGYDGALDHELRNRSIEEVVQPVEEEDVRIFFTAWLKGAYPDDTDDEHRQRVNTSVTEAIEFARVESSHEGGCYMRELGRAVERAIREMYV